MYTRYNNEVMEMGLKKSKSKIKINSTRVIGYVFLMPALIFLIYAVAIPFIWNLILSFQKWDGFNTVEWVGLDNYINSFKDELVIKSLLNSAYLAIFSTIGAVILGLSLAVLVYKLADREGSIFRLLLFSPAMLPTAVVGLLFIFIYNPEMGLLNNFLKLVGLGGWKHVWLEDKHLAMICIMVVNIWKNTGSIMLLCFAAMQAVPDSLFESSKLDGAGYFRQVYQITLPLIKPMILLATINTLGAQFKTFDLVFVMTQGGPGDLTTTVPIVMTKVAFQFGKFGSAASMGVIFAGVVMVAIMIVNRILRGEDYEY